MDSMHYYKGFSPKCRMWYDDATKEKGVEGPIDYRYAKYPASFYKRVEGFSKEKKFDYCFIGSFLVDNATSINRKWIVDFVKERFNDNSYLQFTDGKSKKGLKPFGVFDYTHRRVGFVPKENPVNKRNYFDEHYYKRMCNSKFTLCPSGDSFWSMRFYEALMCKSIPLVISKDETFRSKEESELDYKYYLSSETNMEYRQDWVDHNFDLFMKYHTFDEIPPKPKHQRHNPQRRMQQRKPNPQHRRPPPKPQHRRQPPKPQHRRPPHKPQQRRAPPKPQQKRHGGIFVKLHPYVRKQLEHIRKRRKQQIK